MDARCDDAQVVGQAGGGELLDLRCDPRDYFRGCLFCERLDDLGEAPLAELLSVVARFGYPVGIEQNAGPGRGAVSLCRECRLLRHAQR